MSHRFAAAWHYRLPSEGEQHAILIRKMRLREVPRHEHIHVLRARVDVGFCFPDVALIQPSAGALQVVEASRGWRSSLCLTSDASPVADAISGLSGNALHSARIGAHQWSASRSFFLPALNGRDLC